VAVELFSYYSLRAARTAAPFEKEKLSELNRREKTIASEVVPVKKRMIAAPSKYHISPGHWQEQTIKFIKFTGSSVYRCE
jgi:hypothetical protein